MSEEPPGAVATMLKAAGAPIDRNSFETVELLRDTAAKWRTMRMIANPRAMASNTDPAAASALRVPDAEIYAIDVSFAALTDKAEFDYLNRQPTTFVLPPEAVDRLRAAAGTSWRHPSSATAEGHRCQGDGPPEENGAGPNPATRK